MSYFDMKKRQLINDSMSGLIGQISWQRLTEQLRLSGELQKTEMITGFEVLPDYGLRYRVERV